jgi:hypothetical protein
MAPERSGRGGFVRKEIMRFGVAASAFATLKQVAETSGANPKNAILA